MTIKSKRSLAALVVASLLGCDGSSPTASTGPKVSLDPKSASITVGQEACFNATVTNGAARRYVWVPKDSEGNRVVSAGEQSPGRFCMSPGRGSYTLDVEAFDNVGMSLGSARASLEVRASPA